MGNCLSCAQNSPTAESGNAPVTTVGSDTDGRTRSETVSDPPPARKPAEVFTHKELATATKNFRQTRLLRHGVFGPEYHGQLRNGKDVAVKLLDKIGQMEDEDFFAEVENISLLHHPNLVTFIGYCSEHDQRVLVYEYMPLGSLDRHLYDLPLDREPLDWNTRMKIGAGVAKGLEYLHVCHPEISRDLKTSNILLDEDYHPKLSDCGMAKFDPVDDSIVSMQVVLGTNGYCAPEYAVTGELTPKCEVYSFGVILLELISGRKVIDNTRSPNMRNFVNWAQPLFKDRRQFHAFVDPLLQGYFPSQGLQRAIDIAAMCLHEDADKRPVIRDVVCALTHLESQYYDRNKSDQGGPSSSYKSNQGGPSSSYKSNQGGPSSSYKSNQGGPSSSYKSNQGGSSSSYKSNQSGSSRSFLSASSFLSPSSSGATSSRKGTGSDEQQKKHYFQRGSSSSAADTGTARETQPAAEEKGEK